MTDKEFCIQLIKNYLTNWSERLRSSCDDDGADEYMEISNDKDRLSVMADFIMEQVMLPSFYFSNLKFGHLISAAIEYSENPSVDESLSKVASLFKASHVGHNVEIIVDEFVKYVDNYNFYNK